MADEQKEPERTNLGVQEIRDGWDQFRYGLEVGARFIPDPHITTALEQLTELEKEIRVQGNANGPTSGAELLTVADRIRSITDSLRGESMTTRGKGE